MMMYRNEDLQEDVLLQEAEEQILPQTETNKPAEEPDGMIQSPEEPEMQPESQTDPESAQDLPGDDIKNHAIDEIPQTEAEPPQKRGRPKKTAAIPDSDSQTEPEKPSGTPVQVRVRKKAVLSIDDRPTVETEADLAKNDLLDMLESSRSGRILTGNIQGVEHPDGGGEARGVVYHGAFKVLIPASQAVLPPRDFRDMDPNVVMNFMLTKRLGAEVDFIIKGIDATSGVAVASRLDAMAVKQRYYYYAKDRDGNYKIHNGLCAEARVVAVIRAGIFIDLFGLEVYISLRELSYQRVIDATALYQPGQRILVKILDVDRHDAKSIQVSASVKQAAENPGIKALRRFSEGSCYIGTVTLVNEIGVFVAMDGGIDCLCRFPSRGRPPKGARVAVRITDINKEAIRMRGVIIHVAAPVL